MFAVLAELQPGPFWHAGLPQPATPPGGAHCQSGPARGAEQATSSRLQSPARHLCSLQNRWAIGKAALIKHTRPTHSGRHLTCPGRTTKIQLLSRSHIRPGPPPGAPIAHGTSRAPQLLTNAIQCHKLAAATGQGMCRGPQQGNRVHQFHATSATWELRLALRASPADIDHTIEELIHVRPQTREVSEPTDCLPGVAAGDS